MVDTPYRPKSVFIRTLKRTENILPEIYFMPFTAFSFVESDETKMMGLLESQNVLRYVQLFRQNIGV